MTTTPEAMRESAARWHDQRRRDTPDAFEMEFHEVSARAIRAIPIDLPPQPTPDPHAEALAKALELLLPGDAVMEQILWGDKPDDALGTSTFKMGDLRQARTSLDAYKARKEQG